MIDIEDIRYKQFCLFEKCNSAFGRLILGCVRADLATDTAFNLSYNAIFQKGYNKQVACKLVYFKNTGEWYIEAESNPEIKYRLVECTSNVVKILKVNDIITYKIKDNFARFKVSKFFPKYKRFILVDTNTATPHNLSTVLKNYQTKDIVSITTYDTILNKNTNI